MDYLSLGKGVELFKNRLMVRGSDFATGFRSELIPLCSLKQKKINYLRYWNLPFACPIPDVLFKNSLMGIDN